MAEDDDMSWASMIQGLRDNEPEMVRQFHDRYGRVLHAVAENQISAGFRRRFDADDVVQSAFRTFFRRASGGEFTFGDCEQLWSLLCAITLNKIREKVRYFGRKKRGVDREISVDAARGENDAPLDLPGYGISAEDAVEFTDEFERLMTTLDAEEQQLVDLKLQDLTNEEAAVRMGVSERTVRRILNRIKERLTHHFDVP